MRSLFAFLFRLRALALLLVLEGLCLAMITRGNAFQRIRFTNTSDAAVAKTYEKTSQVKGYFFLIQVNNDLAAENAKLKSALEKYRAVIADRLVDSLTRDTSRNYDYVVGKVVNNSVNRTNNFLTLDRGLADGVRKGMGVVGPTGIVGKVDICSEHFCVVRSLLHSKMTASAEIARISAQGSIKWRGTGPRDASLMYVARHLKPRRGDTVVTSSLSPVFPEGIMVGRIRRVAIKDDDTFYTLDVDLSTNFGSLEYVYIVKSGLSAEQDSLQSRVPGLGTEN
jgi:rod shape-determining protein MreC